MKSNLRELPDEAPVDGRSVTAILIRGSSVIQAKNKGEKRDMAAILQPDDVLLCAWTGQWSTDIFVLPPDKLSSV